MKQLGQFINEEIEVILLFDESEKQYYLNILDKRKNINNDNWQLIKSKNTQKDDSIFAFISLVSMMLGINNENLAFLASKNLLKQ